MHGSADSVAAETDDIASAAASAIVSRVAITVYRVHTPRCLRCTLTHQKRVDISIVGINVDAYSARPAGNLGNEEHASCGNVNGNCSTSAIAIADFDNAVSVAVILSIGTRIARIDSYASDQNSNSNQIRIEYVSHHFERVFQSRDDLLLQRTEECPSSESARKR